MSDTSINNRIKVLMDELRLNPRQFALQCGLDPTVIYNITGSRMNKPSFDVLQKIILSFTNISMQWLVLGEGEMLKNTDVNTDVNTHLMEESEVKYNVLKHSEREKELEAQVQHLTGKVEALMAVIKELSIYNNAMVAPKTGKKSA